MMNAQISPKLINIFLTADQSRFFSNILVIKKNGKNYFDENTKVSRFDISDIIDISLYNVSYQILQINRRFKIVLYETLLKIENNTLNTINIYKFISEGKIDYPKYEFDFNSQVVPLVRNNYDFIYENVDLDKDYELLNSKKRVDLQVRKYLITLSKRELQELTGANLKELPQFKDYYDLTLANYIMDFRRERGFKYDKFINSFKEKLYTYLDNLSSEIIAGLSAKLLKNNETFRNELEATITDYISDYRKEHNIKSKKFSVVFKNNSFIYDPSNATIRAKVYSHMDSLSDREKAGINSKILKTHPDFIQRSLGVLSMYITEYRNMHKISYDPYSLDEILKSFLSSLNEREIARVTPKLLYYANSEIQKYRIGYIQRLLMKFRRENNTTFRKINLRDTIKFYLDHIYIPSPDEQLDGIILKKHKLFRVYKLKTLNSLLSDLLR